MISWFRNGVGIDYNKGYKKYQSLIPSVLEVKKLSPEDAGMYSCMVNNVFGNTIKRTKLEILGKLLSTENFFLPDKQRILQ